MLISPQLVKKFPTFFVIRKYVIVFTTSLFLGVEREGEIRKREKLLERPQLMKLIGDSEYNYFIVYDTEIRSPRETCAASTSLAWSGKKFTPSFTQNIF
jgi:hypothetical protein